MSVSSTFVGYDFKLTTILVVDEFGEGCPAAWCLSNREDLPLLRVFFDAIKKAVGEFNPAWFMSDMAPQFYDAFCLVFGLQPRQLFCAWHVDKAFKDNMKKKIKDFEIEAQVYKQLRIVLEQTNETIFDQYLSTLQDRLASSTVTKKFGEYFNTYFVPHKEKWGYFGRVGLGINTNMFCEAFHRVFKYLYLKGKVNKRVDRCLVNLLKYNRDKTFDRLIKLHKGKSTQKLKQIHERHITSKRIPFTNIKETEEGKWEITSEDGKKIYYVTLLQKKCQESNCQLRCIECAICTHQFCCTCVDHMLYATICKHVHLLQQFRFRQSKADDDTEKIHFQEEEDFERNQELSFLVATVKEQSTTNIEKLQQNAQKSLSEINDLVSNADSRDTVAVRDLVKGLNILKRSFDTLRRNSDIRQIPTTSCNAPHNKNIEQQRHFFQTSKRRKTANVRFAKPTDEDRAQFEKLGYIFQKTKRREHAAEQMETSKTVEEEVKTGITSISIPKGSLIRNIILIFRYSILQCTLYCL